MAKCQAIGPTQAEVSLQANERRVGELLDDRWLVLTGGELTPALSGRTFDVLNPYSEEIVARVPDGGVADAARAVAAAHVAAPAWAALPATSRAERVRALADAIEQRGHDLALLDAVDSGAPITVMATDVRIGVDSLRYFAGLALESKGDTTPASRNLHFTEYQPFGVVARIIPFNHPVMFATSKIAAPLVAGNAVVLKPAEATPLSALLLAKICAEHLPPGVVNIVTGDGPALPDALVRHPEVRRIAFTGSETTGRAIQRAAAEVAVKTVSLELGGKNALLAFPDADPTGVAAGAIAGMNFTWAGQSCGSTSRLLVHESLHDAVVEELCRRLDALRFLPPLHPEASLGTIVNRRQYDRILDRIATALDEGAQLACGGGRPPDATEGLFIAPTVLTGVQPDHAAATEEIFGPVLSVLTWREESEAIALANSVRYGLTGSVYTNDIRRAHRVARALDTGYVWINGTAAHYLGVPYGGWKASGIGREESLEELLSYSQLKSTTVVL
ncbi:aldehyde dehydrogenase family protein [Mycolicibacterium sphagni]|uniref:aldehyde dehydrogenase family protein n=1 Tax=Mycolicibacterium sphagni TaxID=1786 RepID=UPI0021F3019B|nr:aldehyde dehydrogenase family protein [Mycolicibacterium sphagni]MCV7177088.1 aldehyde dehydrogenase family protein [Mycolicibacterium sphagni]